MIRNINFNKSLDESCDKALNVILNFSEYKNFVPGCSGASLIEKNYPIEIGKLEFNILGKEYFFDLKKGTSTPNFLTIFFVLSLSVETMIFFMYFDFFKLSIEY